MKVNTNIENNIQQMNALEKNLQFAIDDLILECNEEPILIQKQISLIITQLAMAAADLRIKKQNEIKNNF